MEERIEPIYLIHYLHGKNISSVTIDNDIYTTEKYSIVLEGEEYATSIEISFIEISFEKYRFRSIFLYEAMHISIDENTITFFIRSSCGIGPSSKIVLTL
jgi:hypothetical protein